MKHPIYRLKKAYAISLAGIAIVLLLGLIALNYVYALHIENREIVALVHRQSALSHRLWTECVSVTAATDEQEFAARQARLAKLWKGFQEQHVQLTSGNAAHYSPSGLPAVDFIESFNSIEDVMHRYLGVVWSENQNQDTDKKALATAIAQFNESLEALLVAQTHHAIVLDYWAMGVSIGIFVLVAGIMLLNTRWLIRPASRLITRMMEHLKSEHDMLEEANHQIQQQLEALKEQEAALLASKEELSVTNDALHELNARLQAQNQELDQWHQEEQALREAAEQATAALAAKEQDIKIAYYELQATETGLRDYSEKLEGANEQLEVVNERLAEANVKAAQLYVELEEMLEREQAQSKALAKANEELTETQHQLVQVEKMASIGQLVSGIAHELNNPMNFISGGVQGLRFAFQDVMLIIEAYNAINSATTPEEQLQATEHASRLLQDLNWSTLNADIQLLLNDTIEGTKRAGDIVKSLRHFIHSEAENWALFDLGMAIDMAISLLGDKLPSDIKLVKGYEKGCQLMCKPSEIQQLFMHLIANAVDAVAAVDEPEIEVHVTRQGDELHAEVRDNGFGIPEHIRDKIFDPFFTTKEVGMGQGLGLSISYAIVKRHGGSIALASARGYTIFTLVLPQWQHQKQVKKAIDTNS